MDGALARCTSIVAAHGGKVLQYAGDSLLAAFGADEAREDDPERAVRAGLALLAEGRALGEEVLRRHGHRGFDVRVGAHTGDVLLGGGVDAEGSIRGIAVNVAARMAQAAPAGALRISHDTYRHVRGVFDVEPQPMMQIKGIDMPIATYLVSCAKPRAFRVATRGIEGVETRMIGRDAELELLQVAFGRLFSERRLSVVTVVAEAGLGKSRLLYEFGNWTETRPERFYLFQGRAHPQTRHQPYGLLRDIVARRLQIADSDSVSAGGARAGGEHERQRRRTATRARGDEDPRRRPGAVGPDGDGRGAGGRLGLRGTGAAAGLAGDRCARRDDRPPRLRGAAAVCRRRGGRGRVARAQCHAGGARRLGAGANCHSRQPIAMALQAV